jgi:DNA repair exonuclease SbcCD ATPase subunit
MKIKHKLLSDYQYLTPDKKIILIKSGAVLEEYNYKVKTDIIPIDKEIVDNNPQLFEIIDWKAELLIYIRTNKLPTPSILTKKIIPFIEEMILSSISQQNSQKLDDSKIRELEQKETDLFSEEQSLNRKLVSIESKERLIKDKEDEIEVRLKRLEKKEVEHKNDLKSLDKKEDELREKGRELINKGLELDDKLQDLNERERNIDLNSLKSSGEIDSKYKKLQEKINKDLKSLSDREKDLESKLKNISKREGDLESKESEIDDKIRNHKITLEDFESYKQEVLKLDSEIKNWENLHWKFQRNTIPPTAIPGTEKL